ncbi:MAG: hypothetical protein H7296_11665, partial [Bacteroidia bacterium]|nr:hypothetical protein [Bacteroidia bacterium]
MKSKNTFTVTTKILLAGFLCALLTTNCFAQTKVNDVTASGTSITLGGTPAHTVGKLPAVGTQVKDFNLTGVDLKEKTLSDFKGKYVIMNI